MMLRGVGVGGCDCFHPLFVGCPALSCKWSVYAAVFLCGRFLPRKVRLVIIGLIVGSHVVLVLRERGGSNGVVGCNAKMLFYCVVVEVLLM